MREENEKKTYQKRKSKDKEKMFKTHRKKYFYLEKKIIIMNSKESNISKENNIEKKKCE